MGKTLIEKVLSSAIGDDVHAGDRVWAPLDLSVVRDFGCANAILRYGEEFGRRRVFDPTKVAVTFDLHVPARDEKAAKNQQMCREFARKQGIKSFFDVSSGIGQHVLLERGFAKPGDIIVGTDSHMNLLGAVEALAVGVGTTDIAASWAVGKTWFRVPDSWKILLTGNPKPETSPKDVILYVLGKLGCDGAIYKSLEFSGDYANNLSLAGRITIASMVTEMSAKIGFFVPDEKILRFLKQRSGKEVERILPDEDASYERVVEVNVSGVEPQVACPHSPDNVKPVSEEEGKRIDEAFIGSCTNGRLEDMQVAARILRGKRIPEGVRLIILPATAEVARKALGMGLYEIFFDAGAVVLNPGCGLCTAGHAGILAPGEVLLSSSNRNFPGKLGKGAEVYLASPATVAASALKGEISLPEV